MKYLQRANTIMSDALKILKVHEVNKEKLKRFLTELLLTHSWSDEFDELQPNGLRYWNHMLHLGLIYHARDNNIPFKITTAGRKWLDEQRN